MNVFIKGTIITILMLTSRNSQAQTASDSIRTIINSLFTAMRNADGAGVREVFADSALLQTVYVDNTGAVSVISEPVTILADVVSKSAKGDADEQIVFETIKIDGPLAVVWTPYKFYFKQKFSHCGVNAFQLVRINGNWSIISIIDTRRRVGCGLKER